MNLTRLFIMLILICSPALAGKKLKLNDQEKTFMRDVELLITNKERKIFKKRLTTHHERARFIQLFWAKRDPDLTDNVNPFYREWMARRDYVLTHFANERDRAGSLSRTDLFMLLGPPDDKSNLVDLTIMGPGYRNAYARFPPVLWIYDDPGYDYKRNKLKVQFVSTSAYGDYVAYTDRLTDHFLRNLKYRFIIHEDLEEAPLMATSSADFQVVAAETPTPTEAATSTDVPPPVEAPVTSSTPQRAATETAPSPSAPPEPQTAVTNTAAAPVEDTTKTLAPPPGASLNVPATITEGRSLTSAVTYDPSAGNDLKLHSATGYFKSGADQRLLLGRVGFPLNSLDFKLGKRLFEAPFQLDYHVFKSDGTAIHGDSIRTEIVLPSKRVLQKRTTWYSNEFAMIVDGDRYTIKAQLKDLHTEKVSYLESEFEVPPLRDEAHMTDMVFMDANVNPALAKFNIRNKPYNIALHNRVLDSETVYPVTELINVNRESDIATIEVQVLQDGKIVKRWDLYSTELTLTNHRSFLLHPALNPRNLGKGQFELRIEVELTSGDLLLSQGSFEIE